MTAVLTVQAGSFGVDMILSGNITTVLYYPLRGYGPGPNGDYRPQPVDPKHISIQKAGDFFRIPSKTYMLSTSAK